MKYRKNSNWSTVNFVYNVKEPLHKLIIHNIQIQLRVDGYTSGEIYTMDDLIDIVDVNISDTKNTEFKRVIVFFVITESTDSKGD
jgi:hypothetical protein